MLFDRNLEMFRQLRQFAHWYASHNIATTPNINAPTAPMAFVPTMPALLPAAVAEAADALAELAALPAAAPALLVAAPALDVALASDELAASVTVE